MTRLALLAPLAVLLLCAMSPPAIVPMGKFQTWLSYKQVPLHFRSGRVDVTIAPLPCPPPARDDSTCTWDHYNNQASVTVTAPGLRPFRTVTDFEASYVRVAVIRIDRRDTRPGLVIGNQGGGSGGTTKVDILQPVGDGFRKIALTQRNALTKDGRLLEGRIADGVHDLTGDGRIDLVLHDPSFDSAFGCNACTPRPPVVLSVIGGRSVDLSSRPSARAIFVHDMVRMRSYCLTGAGDHNGACAAYLADAARVGRFRKAWRDILTQQLRGGDLWQGCTAVPDANRHCPAGAETRYRSFPEAVRAFLVRTGYITAAQAAAAPLS